MSVKRVRGAENTTMYYTHPVLGTRQHPWAVGNYLLFTGTKKTSCHSD